MRKIYFAIIKIDESLSKDKFLRNKYLTQQELEIEENKEKEEKKQKELQEKQAAIRKAQMLAETAFQLVGMITSSVNIFEHATEMFGPFGVPIAVASIAAMFGAFAVALWFD